MTWKHVIFWLLRVLSAIMRLIERVNGLISVEIVIRESINDTMGTITMWIPLGGAFKGHAPKPHPLLSS